MVYVPILKIDLPEPRLEELIPGLVTVVVGACTLAFDAVYDFLHPLSPQGEQQMYEATLMSLPREFRKARRYVLSGIVVHHPGSSTGPCSAFNMHLWGACASSLLPSTCESRDKPDVTCTVGSSRSSSRDARINSALQT
jgi:hypothetical protein